MRWLVGTVIGGMLFALLGGQLFQSLSYERELKEKYGELSAHLLQLKGEEARMEKEIKYLSDPENLKKEVKSRFNYREEGEEMIIIVPPKATSTSDTRID